MKQGMLLNSDLVVIGKAGEGFRESKSDLRPGLIFIWIFAPKFMYEVWKKPHYIVILKYIKQYVMITFGFTIDWKCPLYYAVLQQIATWIFAPKLLENNADW